MSKPTVTVTGASGRLGRDVVKVLASSGFTIKATDRNLPRDQKYDVDVANLLDREACYRLVKDADYLVHLGNIPSPWGKDPQTLYRENTGMNINIFQAAVESGVQKIVFASSVQAVSPQDGEPWQEKEPVLPPYLPMDGDLPPNPGNTYGLSKVAGESMLKYYVDQGQVEGALALRFPFLTNPERFERYKKWRSNWNNISEGFSFLFTSDAAALIEAYLNKDIKGLRIWFPASKQNVHARPVPEMVEEFYKGVELKIPLKKLESLVDLSQITAETGWEPSL